MINCKSVAKIRTYLIECVLYKEENYIQNSRIFSAILEINHEFKIQKH